MRMNEVEINSIVSAARFLNEYVLPVYGSKIGADQITSMKNLSHLDLDELGISIIKRCSDEEALKNPSIILVGAKGKSHRGYEVHGYYRPSMLRQQELMDEGLDKTEAAMQLIDAIPEYTYSDFSYVSNDYLKRKEKRKGKRRK